MNDHQLAAEIATSAGRLLLTMRTSPLISGKVAGAAGDAVANEWITRLLGQVRPEDGFLSEETAPDPARLGRGRVWIIDPLDGTREYGEVSEDRND
jgi:3'(2'), 5'-bisphosphate nucleotidase